MKLSIAAAVIALTVGAVPAFAQSSGAGSAAQSSAPAVPAGPGLSSAGSMGTTKSPYSSTDQTTPGAEPQKAAQNQMYKPDGTTGSPPYGSSTPKASAGSSSGGR